MLARLLAAALAQRLVQPAGPLSPWGYEIGERAYTHSAWSRFRMSLWALRGAVLGQGAWRAVASEENLERLENSPRRRKPATVPEWTIVPRLF